MDQIEMIRLIQDGVDRSGGVWADLGAGTGNFTWALSSVLGSDSTIYAVDRDARAITAQRARIDQTPPAGTIIPMQADFTQPLKLPPLDGMLFANSLHFQRDQAGVLKQILQHLQPEGRVLVVEYETDHVQRWVPNPLPFTRFVMLTDAVGLSTPERVGVRRSPSTGMVLYAAVATRS